MRLVSNPFGKFALGVAVGLLGIGIIAQLTSTDSTIGGVIGAVCGALPLLAEIRIVRGGVVQMGGMVMVRNWTRTWAISRLEIAEVAVVPSGNAVGEATCVGFRLNDGRLIKATPTASYSTQKVLGYQAELMFLRSAMDAWRGSRAAKVPFPARSALSREARLCSAGAA